MKHPVSLEGKVTAALKEQIRRNPPKTQEDCCAVAARQSIAAFGPAEPHLVKATARELAKGLFGPAFEKADEAQKEFWVAMCEKEYRRALLASLSDTGQQK